VAGNWRSPRNRLTACRRPTDRRTAQSSKYNLMMFEKLTFRIRQTLARRRAAKAAGKARKREVRAVIERLVDEVNPKIRAVTAYRRKLAWPVERYIAFSRDVISSFPGPVAASRDTWSREPLIRAFFPNANDLLQVFSRSKAVREFFDANPGADECFGLLSVQRRERTVLGMEMHGDLLKRDVKQTSVSFSDPRVVRAAATEADLRAELEDRAFEATVAYLLEGFNTLLASRISLEAQKDLLDIQLRLARARQGSLQSLLENGAGDEQDVDELNLQSRQTEQALGSARARLTTLDDYVTRICEVLEHPEKHLKVNQIHMRLNEMNIRQDSQSDARGQDLDLTEVSLGTLQRVILITRFPRAELLEKQDFLEEAERRLH